MQQLIIIRGLPGSGKSTLAENLKYALEPDGYVFAHFEADMYFMEPGKDGPVYVFNPHDIPKAHMWCAESTEKALANRYNVIVSNTFCSQWEYSPYIDLGKKYGCKIQVIDLYGNFGNVHNVPQESIDRMKMRWQPFNQELLK